MVTESTELSVDQDPGVSTQEDGDNQDGACILSLPDAALAVIWACLGPSDKKSLFTASRGLRAALSVHAHAISIKTPSDEELAAGYDALPDSLLSLPLRTLHGLRLRATRRYFNRFHHCRSRVSGEVEPGSEHALQQLMAPRSHRPTTTPHAHHTSVCPQETSPMEAAAAAAGPSCAHPSPPAAAAAGAGAAAAEAAGAETGPSQSPSILSVTHMLELQGYHLTPAVAEGLAAAGHDSLVRLELNAVDVSGPFFSGLAGLRACKSLRLEQVQLIGPEAVHSLHDLYRLPSLSSLSLQGIKATHDPDSTTQHHPDLSFLSSLSRLTSFELRCCHIQLAPPPGHCAQLVRWVAAGCHALEVLQIWGVGSIETLGAEECGVLARGCPLLRTLSFDQFVVIEGVPQLLPLSHLTSLSARSLEPHPSDAPWLATATWGSLQKLGMGAFRPSLTSLQCLPLGGLTHPYPLSRLDLSGHRGQAPEALGAAVAAAVANVMRCPVLELPSGKLEVIGTEAASGGVVVGGAVVGGAQQQQRPLPGTALTLTELQPLQAAGLLTQLRLTGLVVGMCEVEALAASVGPSLSSLTLTGCATDPVSLARLAHDARFEKLGALAFGRGCQGVSLAEVEEAVVSPFPRPLLLRVVRPLGPERRPTEGLVATPQDMQGVRERLQAWGKWDVTLEALAHVH